MNGEKWFLEYTFCGYRAETQRKELTLAKDPATAVVEAQKEWEEAKMNASNGHYHVKEPKVILSIDLE